jgi:hypothetical protein
MGAGVGPHVESAEGSLTEGKEGKGKGKGKKKEKEKRKEKKRKGKEEREGRKDGG